MTLQELKKQNDQLEEWFYRSNNGSLCSLKPELVDEIIELMKALNEFKTSDPEKFTWLLISYRRWWVRLDDCQACHLANLPRKFYH